MNFTEKLIALINHNNGNVVTKHGTEAGIPRMYISELVKKGLLERIERGIYIIKDGLDDEYYRLIIKAL